MSTPPFLDLPDGVRATRVSTQRGELAALVADATGSAGEHGPAPVVLVPGFTGSKEDFIAVLRPISDAGHRVVALDQRGQFETPGDDEPASYDLKALAEDVLALIATLGPPVHLLGHSFGGLVARAAALAEPQAVRSLVLLGSGPAAYPHPAAANVGLMVQALPVMDLESIWAVKRQMETQQGMAAPPPDIEEFLHRRFVANNPVGLLRLAEQLLGEVDRVDELAALGLPTLVAYGEGDDGWPPAAQAEMAARLGARVASIAGAAHSPAAQNAPATAGVLTGFWSTVR